MAGNLTLEGILTSELKLETVVKFRLYFKEMCENACKVSYMCKTVRLNPLNLEYNLL